MSSAAGFYALRAAPCLSLINNLEVNEQVLYARIVNVEEATLIE